MEYQGLKTARRALDEKDSQACGLGIAELVPQLQKFMVPNLLIYYLDITLSAVVGNVLLYLAAGADLYSAKQCIFITLSALALFRTSAFIHELSHQGKIFSGLNVYYNLIHGFLHKTPSYTYNSHRYHHMARTYGTIEDPEYDPLGDKSIFYNLVFSPFILMLFAPFFIMMRWGIIPFLLPFIGNKARIWIFQRMSTLVMNMHFVRAVPTEAEKKEWFVQDFGCAVYTLLTAALIWLGILPVTIIGVWLVVVYIICVANFFRAMLNHRYFSGFLPTTQKVQILDSITYKLNPYNFAFYPVGLNYHALHHMLPQMPYHNMGKAHRLLLEILPENHPYRYTIIPNYITGVRQLIRRSF